MRIKAKYRVIYSDGQRPAPLHTGLSGWLSENVYLDITYRLPIKKVFPFSVFGTLDSFIFEEDHKFSSKKFEENLPLIFSRMQSLSIEEVVKVAIQKDLCERAKSEAFFNEQEQMVNTLLKSGSFEFEVEEIKGS